MKHIDFEQPIHIHFIGIGGISMSGLADILFSKGFVISGSDMKASELTDKLTSQGMKIYIGQRAENITPDIDLIVYTAAISKDNEEYIASVNSGITMVTRAELLGEIMTNYKVAIGVSGTHGKTTTTSMITEILMKAGLDPTVSVGGVLPSIGGNLRVGHSDNFITEACEYTNSFLSLFPTIEVILNIEEDHMDFFKDIDDIRNSFRRYTKLLPKDGLLVINGDIDKVSDIYADCQCKIITVGKTSSSEFYASNIRYNEYGCASYTVMRSDTAICELILSVPGLHNVYNSLAAFAVGAHLGIPDDTIAEGLKNFTGTNRRFQKKGELNGITIIDDYAHHPAEISATLSSAANYPHSRVFCIFQPHTYTRTKAFLKDFAKSLSAADVVILTDIYAAREKDTLGISSNDIKKEIDLLGTPCIYEPDFKKIEQYIIDNCHQGDLVITMGAGNIVEVGEALVAGQ